MSDDLILLALAYPWGFAQLSKHKTRKNWIYGMFVESKCRAGLL